MTDNTPEKFLNMGFIQFLGLEPVEAVPGKVVVAVDPQDVHLNHNGTVHAAVLFGLSEVAGAGAAVTGMMELAADSYTVVKKATIEYLAPARGKITASGEISADLAAKTKAQVQAGERIEIDVPVAIIDASGTEAVRASLTISVRPRRK